MNNNLLIRIGGLSALLGIALGMIDSLVTGITSPEAVPMYSKLINALSAVSLIPLALALFILFRSRSPALSLLGLIEATAAAALYVVSILFLNLQPLFLYNLAFTGIFMVPPLIFGVIFLTQGRSKQIKILGILGTISGAMGIARFILLTLAGGDWTNINNPTLAPFIVIAYLAWLVSISVWSVWTGILLVGRRPFLVEPAVLPR